MPGQGHLQRLGEPRKGRWVRDALEGVGRFARVCATCSSNKVIHNVQEWGRQGLGRFQS